MAVGPFEVIMEPIGAPEGDGVGVPAEVAAAAPMGVLVAEPPQPEAGLHVAEALPAAVQQGQAASGPCATVSPVGPPTWLQHLHLLPCLRSLELGGCLTMVDADCAVLAAGLPHGVRELALRECPGVGGVGLRELAGSCARIRSLALAQSSVVTARDVVLLLDSNPKLERLNFDRCSPITPDQFDLIMQRFIAAGRSSLDIACSP